MSTAENTHVLVALCASHIDSPKRLRRLGQMLDSWMAQAGGSVPMYLAISCNAGMMEAVQGFLQERVAMTKAPKFTFHALMATSKMAQFMQYKDLCEYIGEKYAEKGKGISVDRIWVMFTDDDDIWHPFRVMGYRELLVAGIEQESGIRGHDVPDDILALCVIPHAEYASEDCMRTEVGVADVEAGIRSGKIVVRSSADEHWQYACRLRSLRDFVERADDMLLAHRYCDLYFVRYLRNSLGYRIINMGRECAEWLYAYLTETIRRTEKDVYVAVDDRAVLLASKMGSAAEAFESVCNNEMLVRDVHADDKGMMIEWVRKRWRAGKYDVFINAPLAQRP